MTKLNLMERLRSWAHNRSLDLKPRRHGMVGPAAMWKMKRDFQIGFLKGQGLEPHHRLMDVGCGTLRGGIPMIRYLNEGNYYGCDVRSEALEEARRELEDEGLTEKGAHLINSGDFDALQLDVEFDVMYGFSVLIHMEDAIVEIFSKCTRPPRRIRAWW